MIGAFVLRVALLLGFVLSAAGPAFAASDTSDIWLPSEPLKGREVFEAKHCTQCHSIGGAGGNIGPDLAEAEGYFHGSFLDLSSILWNHIPDMLVEYRARNLVWPTFSDAEVTHLISYLYYLRYLGTPGDVPRGKALTETKGCLRCHAVGGRKAGASGPKLDQLKRYASPIYVVQAIWNHGPRMQQMIAKRGMSFPEFTGQEISDISAYIRDVSRGSTDELHFLSPGDPTKGKTIFSAKGCGKCHATEQKGGESAPNLDKSNLNKSAAGIAAMMWNHADVMIPSMREENISWPTFEGKEMADLVAYMYFLAFIEPPGNPTQGKKAFEARQCLSCHSIGGGGEKVGPDLAASPTLESNKAILRAMINHAESMADAVLGAGKSWPLLDGDEMRNIFAYLQSVQKKK